MPGSLAIIVAAFAAEERAAAIGAWTAWGAIAALVGPLAGGVIVDQLSWRWIFALNLPLVALTLVLVRGRGSPNARAYRGAASTTGRVPMCPRPRRDRLRAHRAASLRLVECRHPRRAPRRVRHVRGLPRPRAAGRAADAEARALRPAQLRRRQRRDARHVRRPRRPVLLPRRSSCNRSPGTAPFRPG